MSAQSVTLKRTSFSAMVDQVVPCLISPHKAKVGCSHDGLFLAGTALLPDPHAPFCLSHGGAPSLPMYLSLLLGGDAMIARRTDSISSLKGDGMNLETRTVG